jgi:hypothetical protein
MPTMPGPAGRLDETLEDAANLPEPHVIAQEIAEDPQTALEEIEDIRRSSGAHGCRGAGLSYRREADSRLKREHWSSFV